MRISHRKVPSADAWRFDEANAGQVYHPGSEWNRDRPDQNDMRWVSPQGYLWVIGKECCLAPKRVLLEDEGGGEEGVQDWGWEG